MSHVVTTLPSGQSTWPSTGLGKIALTVSLIAIASLVVFPLITTVFADTFPVVDTWIMPAIQVVIIDGAAVLGALAVWLAHERSPVTLALLVVTTMIGLFWTFMVVGETLGGA